MTEKKIDLAMTTVFAPPERYEVDGFLLRPFTMSDRAQIARTVRESYEHLARFIFWARPEYNENELDPVLRTMVANYVLRQDFSLLILSPDGSEIYGGTGFHRPQIATATAEIGMWISKARAGRGLGTSVLRAMLHWGFQEWPWERLEWRCDTENVPSRRTAESAGMKLDGILRKDAVRPNGERYDTCVYSALRGDA